MKLLTSIIVLPITAGGLQPGGAVLAVPAGRTLAAPGAVEVCPALPVVAAHGGAALQCAVTSIPAGDAETGPVLTLTVLLTPCITVSVLTVRALPSLATDTPHVLTVTVVAALQAALLYTAVSSSPALVTATGLTGLVESSVVSTARDTLAGLGVHLATVNTQPAFLADTGPANTVAVARTVRV